MRQLYFTLYTIHIKEKKKCENRYYCLYSWSRHSTLRYTRTYREHTGLEWIEVFSVTDSNRSRDVLAPQLAASLLVRMVSGSGGSGDIGVKCFLWLSGCKLWHLLKEMEPTWPHMLPIKVSNQISSPSASHCCLNHDALLPWRVWRVIRYSTTVAWCVHQSSAFGIRKAAV